jgi:hypothetical protein
MRNAFLVFLALLGINILLAVHADRWRFDSIVVHHSATQTGDYAFIKALHAKRGWEDAAYQLIMSNGTGRLPSGTLEASGRYHHLLPGPATSDQTSNLGGLHMCIIGNYQITPVPEDLKAALGRALRELCRRFHVPPQRILFHRDVNATLCPGKYIQKKELLHWMNELAYQCTPAVARQQDQVLDTAGLINLRSYPHFLLLLHLASAGAFALFVLIAWKRRKDSVRSNRHTSDLPRRTAPKSGRTSRRPSGSTVRYPRPR